MQIIPLTPASVTYERTSRFTGSADGTLTITASEESCPITMSLIGGQKTENWKDTLLSPRFVPPVTGIMR